MSWADLILTKKYILPNILGRKNIQVLKLDNIEECYKRMCLQKMYAENLQNELSSSPFLLFSNQL